MNEMDKKLLRKQIMSLRTHLTHQERIEAEAIVFETLTNFEPFIKATSVSSFVDFRNEISMMAINQSILGLGKTLLLPYISPVTKDMQFYKVDDLSELKRNAFGIMEPNPEVHTLFDITHIECVITPGIAFDENGYRLGYGGGFYDRFFSKIEKAIPKIGIAYELQVVSHLPIDPYDQPITHLITEKGLKVF